MSECVVRMEMPKCCDDCDVNYDCCACGISGEFWFHNPRYKEFDSSKERLPNCPIICQLPEGHGRLVDADTLKEHSVHFGETEYTFDFDAVFVEEIDEAPTIIPANTAERSET